MLLVLQMSSSSSSSPPSPPHSSIGCGSYAKRSSSSSSSFSLPSSCHALLANPSPQWTALQRELRCASRHTCLFSDNRKQEQARKALENALGQKKTEFENWSKEIEKRQEKDSGGASGHGGWFGGGGGGGGGWFGWFGGEHFWEEAQQAILTIVGIISLYLLMAKGNVMFAVVSNSLLFVLRSARKWLAFISSCLSRRTFALGSNPGSESNQVVDEMYQNHMSAKERVLKKWGMD